MKLQVAKLHASRQLKQVQRWDPATAERARKVVNQWPNQALRITSEALINRLASQGKTVQEKLWRDLVMTAEVGETKGGEYISPTHPGKQVYLGTYAGFRLYLYCSRDGMWRLTRRYWDVSRPIIYWGRDDTNISAPQVGKWKLHSQARRNFERWVDEGGLGQAKMDGIQQRPGVPGNR